jgi:hypothetical protein
MEQTPMNNNSPVQVSPWLLFQKILDDPKSFGFTNVSDTVRMEKDELITAPDGCVVYNTDESLFSATFIQIIFFIKLL